MSDRSRHDGVTSERTGEQPSRLQEIAAELRSAGVEDPSEGWGRRRLMEPLSFGSADATIGLAVAFGPAPFPLETKTVTTIEPRPRLVVCQVDFAPAIHGSVLESLSGSLRRAYPHASAPRVPAGPSVFFSDPDRNWAVWLTPFALGLETSRFKGFGELHDRLGEVVRLLDAGLYKRVGLRSVYHVPSSWTVAPKPLPQDKQHLGQVVQWRSQGGHAYFDLDVFAENVKPASLDEHLEEIFQASQQLSHEEGVSEMVFAPDTAVPPLRPTPPTAVEAFPELLPPFEQPAPPEVETVASKRAELLARKYSGEELPRDEQERLASLTARLEKLLPPVSDQDLQNLLEMAQEAEQIRKWSWERRQRLGLN